MLLWLAIRWLRHISRGPQPVVNRNPWKPIAIALAVLLAAVLIAAALVATDVMKLGFSLL